MPVYKKNNKYYYKGKYKLPDGSFKDYNRLAKTATTKGQAETLELEFLRTVSNQEYLMNDITFLNLSDRYMEFLKKSGNVKNSSYTDTQYLLKKINGSIGGYKINIIKKFDIQKYINDLSDIHSYKYVEKIYYTINKVFVYALKNDYLYKNPCFGVYLPVDKNKVDSDMMFWEMKHFKVFVSRLDYQPVFYEIYNFLYFMGCRKGEALALLWSDIDFDKGKVRINKTITRKAGTFDITTPKTKNSNRIISMPNCLIADMIKYRDYQLSINNYDLNGYIFSLGFNKPLSYETLRRHFKDDINLVNFQLKKEEKELLPVLRIHDLRHSHASYLISLKQYDYDIAKRLGDTVETLHKVYAHWFDSADIDIINAMNENI